MRGTLLTIFTLGAIVASWPVEQRLASATGSPVSTPNLSVENRATGPDYDVYAALLLDARWRGELDASKRVFVLMRETADVMHVLDPEPDAHLPGFPLDLALRIPSASKETVEDFVGRNKTRTTLEAKFPDDLHVVILSAAERIRIFGKTGTWDEFYRQYRFANGIIELSRVGQNRSGDEALVYVMMLSNLLAGSGDFVLLRRTSAGWRIATVYHYIDV